MPMCLVPTWISTQSDDIMLSFCDESHIFQIHKLSDCLSTAAGRYDGLRRSCPVPEQVRQCPLRTASGAVAGAWKDGQAEMSATVRCGDSAPAAGCSIEQPAGATRSPSGDGGAGARYACPPCTVGRAFSPPGAAAGRPPRLVGHTAQAAVAAYRRAGPPRLISRLQGGMPGTPAATTRSNFPTDQPVLPWHTAACDISAAHQAGACSA